VVFSVLSVALPSARPVSSWFVLYFLKKLQHLRQQLPQQQWLASPSEGPSSCFSGPSLRFLKKFPIATEVLSLEQRLPGICKCRK
jgi:hypothetical protein